MEILYRKNGKQVNIVRCLGLETWIELPSVVEDLPVRGLSPYLFSNHKRKEEDDVIGPATSTLPILCGNTIEAISIPETVLELGNYLFYGCGSLRNLSLYDSIVRTGRGMLTGCHLERIQYNVTQDNYLALKDILGEQRFRIEVTICDQQRKQEQVLLFPEYYEEAVENTPARIVENHFHGAGYKYRQCVSKKGIDYELYDHLFQDAIFLEEKELVCQIAMMRILYPVQLEKEYKDAYIRYMKEHITYILRWSIAKEELGLLHVLGEENLWEEESLDFAIEEARKQGKNSCLSFFMEEKNRKYPPQKKTFEL